MKRIKLIITHPSQLIPRTVAYFGMDELKKVFDLEYWDCASIVYPAFFSPWVIERDYVKKISSIYEFKSEIEKLPEDTIVVSAVDVNDYNYCFHKIQSSCIKNKIYVDFFAVGDVYANYPKGVIGRLKNKLYRNDNLRQIIKWYKHHKDATWGASQCTDLVNAMYDYTYVISVSSRVEYRINHPDYENYMQAKDIMDGKKYIVFLDQFFPLHPECKYLYPELQERQVREEYYSSMNNFFDMLERHYGCEVVIAAHPYASYNENNPFNGRKIFVYTTPELVKYSYAVCMHNTGAISYVMLADKPVCVMTEKWLNTVQASNLEKQRQLIQIPITNIDSVDNVEDVFTRISPEIRENYIQRFLHDKNESRNNAELFAEYLTDIYHRIQSSKTQKHEE